MELPSWLNSRKKTHTGRVTACHSCVISLQVFIEKDVNTEWNIQIKQSVSCMYLVHHFRKHFPQNSTWKQWKVCGCWGAGAVALIQISIGSYCVWPDRNAVRATWPLKWSHCNDSYCQEAAYSQDAGKTFKHLSIGFMPHCCHIYFIHCARITFNYWFYISNLYCGSEIDLDTPFRNQQWIFFSSVGLCLHLFGLLIKSSWIANWSTHFHLYSGDPFEREVERWQWVAFSSSW